MWRAGAPAKKDCSRFTASLIIPCTVPSGTTSSITLYNLHANSMCCPSSRMMSSLEWQSPGNMPRDRAQKMAANDEEKNTPSTIAKALTRVANEYVDRSNHLRHQSAFFFTDGMVSTAPNRRRSSPSSRISSCRNRA